MKLKAPNVRARFELLRAVTPTSRVASMFETWHSLHAYCCQVAIDENAKRRDCYGSRGARHRSGHDGCA